MVSRAIARFIRISPRKMRQVVDLIRGKNVHDAFSILTNLNKRAAEFAEDVLMSATSNATSNAKGDPEVKKENLRISKIVVDGGPTLKRLRAMSMGRAGMIRHRTSHITVELDMIAIKKV